MQVKVWALIRIGDRLAIHAGSRRGEPYPTLPGGRVQDGETLHDALRREVMEELALEIEVGRLRYVAEVVHGHTVQDLNLVFDVEPVEGATVTDLPSVDPRAPDQRVMPPVLAAIADDPADAARGPRWLGNIWQPGM